MHSRNTEAAVNTELSVQPVKAAGKDTLDTSLGSSATAEAARLRWLPKVSPREGLEIISGFAKELAGTPQQMTERAQIMEAIYRDSGGNHVFPLLAAHGGLW